MSINTIRCNDNVETSSALKSNPGARVLGGGTLLMRSVNEGDQSFDTLVRNQDPGRGQIRVEGEQLVMGAGVTMSQVLQSREATFLHETARLVGGPAIRNMATVAGNLFAQCPYGDMATALLALDGEVLLSGESQRQGLAQLLATRDSAPRALVVEVRCQRPARPADFRFHKVSRVKPKGVSVLAIATHLPGAGSGRMTNVRVAFGAMASTPLRNASVERSLEGQNLDETSIMAACQYAVDGLDPPTDRHCLGLVSTIYCTGASGTRASNSPEATTLMAKIPVQLTLNGTDRSVFVEEGQNLLDVLRRSLGDLTPKYGCGQGTCGSCTIKVDGELRLACLTLAESVDGATVNTVAGLADGPQLHALQQAFIDHFAAQCGYCTTGMLMSASALLEANPSPTREEVVDAIAGNICRCTGYEPIIDAILAVAGSGSAVGAGQASTRGGR